MKASIPLLLLVIVSCADQKFFDDPQGNRYKVVKIGERVWMAENLNYEVTEGSCCYDDDSSNCDEMGRLYTWRAAMEAAGEIDGWHLPSKEEWNAFLEVCGEDSAGYINITSQELGFNPLWAGVRVSYGEYKAKGLGANYWSSTPSDTNTTLSFSVAVMGDRKMISVHNYPQDNACSVRLVRD